MWSSVTIPGAPRLLMVDATGNVEGWEWDFSVRLCNSLQRSELQIETDSSVRIDDHAQFLKCLKDSAFNCLLLFAHADSIARLWNVLRSQPRASEILCALCTPPGFDAQVSEAVLQSAPAVVPLAITPLSPMTPREAGLFYLKFFTELRLHSADSISGKMVWFSFSKAKELLRRRRYSAKFGVR